VKSRRRGRKSVRRRSGVIDEVADASPPALYYSTLPLLRGDLKFVGGFSAYPKMPSLGREKLAKPACDVEPVQAGMFGTEDKGGRRIMGYFPSTPSSTTAMSARLTLYEGYVL